jgi:hypothetical protein
MHLATPYIEGARIYLAAEKPLAQWGKYVALALAR